MKRCSKCGETKPLDTFSVRRASGDGLTPICKPCISLKGKAWRAAHPDRKRAADAAWRAANTDRKRTANAAWAAANSGRVSASHARWAAANPDKLRQSRAAWNSANPDKRRRLKAALQSRRKARQKNALCERVSLADIIARDGPTCYICGFITNPSAPPRTRARAELEHVIPLSRGGSHTMENLRCACYPCNAAKGARLTAEQVRAMFD